MAGETLRPETHALDALIQATVMRVNGRPVANDAMLFVGNRHEAFPVWVVQDPILEPVDKIVWMVIRLHARGPGCSADFPSYADIGRQANIASDSTIGRSIAILRITRWLSLCARVREPCGRFLRNIYALHDEPLPLPDALHFDRQYLRFLDEALTHNHARVRSVARGVLETLDRDIATQRDVCNELPGVEQRLAAAAAVTGQQRRYFGFDSVATQRLRHFKRQDQNSKMEPPRQPRADQNSKCRSSSDLFLTKHKTTTTEAPNFEALTHNERGERLTFPPRFSANERELAARYLAGVPAELRQRILDETEGRFRAERRGMPAVYDDLRFLASLCRAALGGEFQPNLGLKIDAERAAQAAEREQRIAAAAATAPADREAPTATARASLAELRAALGMTNSELGPNGPKREAD